MTKIHETQQAIKDAMFPTPAPVPMSSCLQVSAEGVLGLCGDSRGSGRPEGDGRAGISAQHFPQPR